MKDKHNEFPNIYSSSKDTTKIGFSKYNVSVQPNNPIFGDLRDIIEVNTDDNLILSDKAKQGILRRNDNNKMDERYLYYLTH